MFDRLAWAVEMAAVLHAEQVDKIGQPYILHPAAVANTVAVMEPADLDAIALAWLHDTLEDGFATHLERLIFEHSVADYFGDAFLADLKALTHVKGEPYRAYIERVHARGGRAVSVKLADLAHNRNPRRRSTDPGTEARQRKYAESEFYLINGAWPDDAWYVPEYESFVQ